jgi:polar amino acid transport system permease protein
MAFLDNLPALLDGAWVTIQVTVLSAGVAIVLAVLAGVGMLSRRWPVRLVSRSYTEFFRGVSVLVLLFWFFFSLPVILEVRLTPLQAAVLALGLNIGAYEAEIVRGAVQSVPRGQWEAARALNMSATLRMRRIIIPQALPLMIPPLGNMTIQLLKATALVSLISLNDLTFEAQSVRASTGESADVFLGVLVMYFVLAYAITLGMRWVERRVRVERVV